MTDQSDDWIPITTIGDSYEIELNVRAEAGSSQEYRHRPIDLSGECEHPWTFGEPPRDQTPEPTR